MDTLLGGFGVAETLFWLPGSPAYEASKANYYAFDLDKAAALLRDAGATSFELEYLISPNFPELADFGQIYQADLAKIGVSAHHQTGRQRAILRRYQQSQVHRACMPSPVPVRSYNRVRCCSRVAPPIQQTTTRVSRATRTRS